MASQAFDVVLAPDFSEPVASRFEILTLMFLASWIEFGGRSRDLPLHLACIGEAPKSVRVLADRCGALITTHSPLHFGEFANKLRGFEVNRQTDHVLLLDSDMLVLSEIHGLPTALGGEFISAAPSIGPCRVPSDRWIKAHEAIGLPYPDNRVIPLNLALDTFQCAPYRKREDFPPYYNGGIVFASWESGLGDVWRDHLTRFLEFSPDILGAKRRFRNQPSLATAIHALQLNGFGFRLLPDEYHVHWQHIAAGSVPSQEAKLLHTVGFGRWLTKAENDRLAEEKGTYFSYFLRLKRRLRSRWIAQAQEKHAEEQIDAYVANILALTRRLRSHRDPLTRIAHYFTRRPQIRDCYRVYGLMKLLYDKYVRELKR